MKTRCFFLGLSLVLVNFAGGSVPEESLSYYSGITLAPSNYGTWKPPSANSLGLSLESPDLYQTTISLYHPNLEKPGVYSEEINNEAVFETEDHIHESHRLLSWLKKMTSSYRFSDFDVTEFEESVEDLDENELAFISKSRVFATQNLNKHEEFDTLAYMNNKDKPFKSKNEEDMAYVESPGIKPFFIGKKRVTNQEYLKYMQATRAPAPSHWVANLPKPGEENEPVTHVSYREAEAFANWSGKRLPTFEEFKAAEEGQAMIGASEKTEWLKGDLQKRNQSMGFRLAETKASKL